MIMKVYILWVVFLFAVFSSVDCTPIEFENRRTLSTTTSTCIEFPPHELAVLYDFYVAGNGDLWSYPPAMGNPWNFNQPNPNPCSQNWAFVNCTQFTTQDNCSITEIVFFRSYYSGTIPSSVSNLTNLVIFAFQYEYGVYGTIPSSIGNLTSLQVLAIAGSQIHGMIPTSFADLRNLSLFSIYDNYLTGTYPSFVENWSYVEYLDFGSNNFHGQLPSVLWNMTQVGMFYVDDNNFTGTISDSIGNLKNLVGFDFSDNSFTGTIPETIGALVKCDLLRFSFNKLTGRIPNGIGNLVNASYIYLSDNLLSGHLPITMAGLYGLQELNISTNMLSGSIPEFVGVSLIRLNSLCLENNQFTGEIPILRNNALQTLSLAHNQLSGNIPVLQFQLQLETDIYINNNLLTGSIPNALGNLVDFTQFSFAENFLTGTLPVNLLNETSSLIYLYGSSNLLTGTIPSGFVNRTQLISFLVSSNYFTGTIPEWTQDVALAQLDFSDNQLSGSIPESLFLHAPNLSVLSLVSNCLVGSIPSSLCSLKNKQLSVLAMDGLHAASSCRVKLLIPTISTYLLQDPLHGSLPSCLFTDYPELQEVHFSGTGLEGTLPDIDSISSKLTNLTLSHNFLSGIVPKAFWQHSWRNLDLSYNKFTGIINNISILLPNDASTSSSSSLKLSQNRFSGDIPQVKNLQQIRDINILSGNMFRCTSLDGTSNLPQHDPHYSSYQCGSIFTDAALYVFVVCLGFCVISFVITWLFRHRLQTDEFYNHMFEYFLVVSNPNPTMDLVDILDKDDREIDDDHGDNLMSMASRPTSSIGVNQNGSELSELIIRAQRKELRRMAGIYHLSQVCKGLRRWLLWLAFLLFVIFIPIFLSLTVKYSTYTYSYVWQVSSAFVSGETPASIYFIVFFLALFCMYSRLTERARINVAYLIRQFPRDCHPNYEPPEHIQRRPLSIFEITTRSSTDTGMPEHSPLVFTKKTLLTVFGNTNPDSVLTAEQIPSWVYTAAWYFRMTCFLLYNGVLVFTINIAYVYYTSAGSSHLTAVQKEFFAIFVSLYKICYNAFMITMLRWLGPRKYYILPQYDPTVQIVPHKSNMALVAYMLLISVFNQVVVPAISVMIFSDNCFYNAFVPSQAISTQLNYQIGESDDRRWFYTGQYVTVNSDYSLSPPFSYSFQCSSQLLVSFTPVFVYRFLIDGLLFPCLLVLLKKWQLWGYARKGWQSNVYQYVTMFLNSSLRPIGLKEWDDVNATTVFSGDRFTVGLVCDIAIILSFGTAFPVLAIIGAISVCVRSVFLQLTIGRVVVMSRQYPDLQEFVERTSNECRKVGRTLLKTLPVSMWLMSVFWSTFLFDMMGSQGNENPMHKAIWIFLSMALFVPLLIIGTNRCYDYCLKRMKKSGGSVVNGVGDIMQNVLHSEKANNEQIEFELSEKPGGNAPKGLIVDS